VAVDDHAALLELDAVDLHVRTERLDDAAVRPERGDEELELVVVAVGRRRTREGGALLEGGRDRPPVGVARPLAPPVNPRPRVAGANMLGTPSGAPVGAGEILGFCVRTPSGALSRELRPPSARFCRRKASQNQTFLQVDLD
jgi:hypothetical protein